MLSVEGWTISWYVDTVQGGRGFIYWALCGAQWQLFLYLSDYNTGLRPFFHLFLSVLVSISDKDPSRSEHNWGISGFLRGYVSALVIYPVCICQIFRKMLLCTYCEDDYFV